MRTRPRSSKAAKPLKSLKAWFGQVVAVGEEEDARAALAVAGEIPAGFEKFPRDLKRDGGLAPCRWRG
jgi:hypothetical protein